MANKNFVVHPIISPVQKIILFKTKARFYLVGSNNTQEKFRVLKIDRTDPKELNVIDDKVEYNKKEIKQLLNMIEHGNVTKQGQKYVTDLNRTISAFGIVGFIKFLEGYYIILITKRKRVAIIGHHTIYKIQDTCMVYIPSEHEKNVHPHEAKYLKIFQSMDLSSNFYFSYSYDISHTLQYNMASLKELSSLNVSQDAEQIKSVPFWNPQLHSMAEASEEVATGFLENLRESDSNLASSASGHDILNNSSSSESGLWSELRSNDEFVPTKDSSEVHYGISTKPHWRFVWNSFLLEPVDLHSDWLLYITHGFIGQSNINVYGRPVYLTLIARRSQYFAGTRFLKRGANDKGDVANEVETEQIVFDSFTSSLNMGHFTSFVQLRGSIPSQWSQDISKIVPKPPIMLDNADPFCFGAGQHFNDLLRRYGCPIIILNLVKKKEQKRHESILSEEYCNAIEYLNQFLPPSQRLINIGFDMAHINNKLKEAIVMPRLAQIAYYVISKIGIFHNHKEYYCQKINPHSGNKSLGGFVTENEGRLQTGVVRVNCVDCLDRTNTAQFALGKAALAFQLYMLGVLESPSLEFDTDSVRMLEELYEDHGDTLALQYGGSQLVHRIKTYRKIAPLSSHSRDIMQTLSRYYSNTFSDADKQNAINLFLGVYKPTRTSTPLWEMPTDYYLHNSIAAGNLLCHRNLYTCWWDDEVQRCLPFASNEVNKEISSSVLEIIKTHPLDPRIDGFFDHYRPFEMSIVTELLSFTLNHSIRDVMPNFSNDFSPFSVRVRPGKKRECLGDKPPNPSVSGFPSTASSGASETDSDDSSGEDNFIFLDIEPSVSSFSTNQMTTFENQFTSMKQEYGIEIKTPSEKDMRMYTRYVNIGKSADDIDLSPIEPKATIQSLKLSSQSHFKNDSSFCVNPPTIRRQDMAIYEAYIHQAKHGPSPPSKKSVSQYQSFVFSRFL